MISERVKEWKVSEEEVESDHKLITYEIEMSTTQESEKYRNIRKTRWDLYRHELKQNLESKEVEGEELDKIVEHINESIIKAFHESCTEKDKKNKKKVIWWNDNLTGLKRISYRAQQRYRATPNEETRRERNQTRTEYQNAIKKAKEESWKLFCSSMEDLSTLAKIQKLMKQTNNRIGTIRKSNGTYTTTPKETLDELIDTLYPDDTNTSEQRAEIQQEINTQYPGNPLAEEEIEIMINKDTIETAIRGFDPYKSPGPDGIYPALLQKGINILQPYLKTHLPKKY